MKEILKKILGGLLTTAMILSLAGCGSSGTSATASSSGSSTNTEGVSLTIGIGTDLTAIDPQMSNKLQDVIVYGNIFDTLVNMDKDMNIIPGLAESWERVSDKQTNFKLREDVKFSNGDELTADDVVFSIQRVIDSPYVNYLLSFVDHAEKIDDHTVAVYSKEAFGPVLQHFTVPYSGIVPKKLVEEQGEAFSMAPIGSGAYKLKEWKPGDYVLLEANENYWGDKPEISEVKFNIMPETSQRLMALESGEIDVAYDVAPNDMAKAAANSELTTIAQPSMASFFLPMNLAKEGPLQDVNVRHAIDWALDRQAICDAVASGYAAPSGLVIAPACVGYSAKYAAKERDLDKAKEYLAKSNYPDGCEISLYTNDNSERVEAANIIQYQLSEIGIKVNVEVMEASAVSTYVQNGDFDTIVDRWLTDTCDAYYTLTGMYASWSSVGEGNDAFYASDAVDELIIEAGKESDDAKRVADYEKVYDAFEDDMPYIMTYYPYTCIAMRNNVTGFVINPNGAHQIRLLHKD